MPKRIIDGDALWRSEKLSQVQPPEYRAELANLIPLSLANGVFESDARLIWARVYVFNRPEITLESVDKILAEFERVKILFRWKEPNGKTWGFWPGIERPGRLPGPSRKGRHEAVGPNPPETELFDFLNPPTESNGIPSGIPKGIHDGNQHETAQDSNGCLGSGFGSVQVQVKGLENSKDLPRSEKATAKGKANSKTKSNGRTPSSCKTCGTTKNVSHILGDVRFCDKCWNGARQ